MAATSAKGDLFSPLAKSGGFASAIFIQLMV